MKYEEWIKYEEERLRRKEVHTSKAHITINGRALSGLTLDEMLALMRAWVAEQPPRLLPQVREEPSKVNSQGVHAV
ncbi:MAG: hypothetical protein DWQ07_06545 [Chloroflexi bacterium]|nr:MAG: hypothetical protein DWQ07_06545 [Chloroflexota bacterium]MBL1195911.1 hypothetical protein [Chloroflexota bacterium]NOH13204.1 hypothetical protein [Chloroflexota bacterium]